MFNLDYYKYYIRLILYRINGERRIMRWNCLSFPVDVLFNVHKMIGECLVHL